MPVGDSAFGQVVGREFQRNPVAIHDFDPIAPESPRHGRQYCLACIEFDRKHPSFELLNNLSRYFYRIFFWQDSPSLLRFDVDTLLTTGCCCDDRHRRYAVHRRRIHGQSWDELRSHSASAHRGLCRSRS